MSAREIERARALHTAVDSQKIMKSLQPSDKGTMRWPKPTVVEITTEKKIASTTVKEFATSSVAAAFLSCFLNSASLLPKKEKKSRSRKAEVNDEYGSGDE